MTGDDVMIESPGLLTVNDGVAPLTVGGTFTTNCFTVPSLWTGLQTYPPNVLAQAVQRANELEADLAGVEARKAELAMLRRMIAAAQDK